MSHAFAVALRRLVGAGLVVAAASVGAELPQRQHILIVGSSTTYPIITAAAEHLGRQYGSMMPVVESTGSGGGIKLFCSGIGLDTPDIVMASRQMKASERAACARAGVHDIREIRIGHDGIVVANSKQGPPLALRSGDLYRALAREVPAPGDPSRLITNPYQSWQQIDPALPDQPIRVLGPPPTSGTRDILIERLLGQACQQVPLLAALQASDPQAYRQHCHALREDGGFVNAGENDARVVRKLFADPEAVGIFGFNFLDRNRDRLQAASIDGVVPRFESIESGTYPLSRPLYLYLKPQHTAVVPGLQPFIEGLLAPEISGPEGFLLDHGLIPLNGEQRDPVGTPSA